MAGERTLDEIQKALRAHGMWKLRLKTAITTGSSEFRVEDVRCDDKCEFGRWLHDKSMPASIRNGMPYQVIKRLHADFHQTAASALGAALSGNKAGAQGILDGEFAQRSDKLMRALMKWKGELH